MFDTLKSYALELKAIQFETARTSEIYRLVRSYHFDSLGHETGANTEYDHKGPYLRIYETMFTMKETESKCYNARAEICNTNDMAQLSSCINSTQYRQKLAMQMINQVREIMPDSRQKWNDELTNKRENSSVEKTEDVTLFEESSDTPVSMFL